MYYCFDKSLVLRQALPTFLFSWGACLTVHGFLGPVRNIALQKDVQLGQNEWMSFPDSGLFLALDQLIPPPPQHTRTPTPSLSY